MQRKSSKEKNRPKGSKDHPAGDDLEAQRRWDLAMGVSKAASENKESASQKREKLTEERLVKSHGGLEDWVYQAGNLVSEVAVNLEEESAGLHSLLTVARDCARTLSDDLWSRFQEVPRRCVHALDKDVITTLFSAAEPQWRTLLTTPKKGGTCVFLHIGTEPPSTPIVELLTKLGWFGVCVCADPPTEGNEDRVQHVLLDPTSEEDEEAIIKLQVAKGSLLPKPATFMLAFADVVWDSDNIDGNQDKAELFKKIDNNTDGNIARREFKAAQNAGLIKKELKFKNFDINGDGCISKDEFVQAIKAGFLGEEEKMLYADNTKKPDAPVEQSGYGLLGVTWSPQVRWRLRMLRNVISVALQRLSNQGSLCVTWHGIPNHPALMFITSQLRPVFLRVHVLVPDGTRSWETWILAAGFKRSEAEEVAAKGGGFMFKNFIDSAYRCADLDDCLLWTLPVAGLVEEYRLGGGERTIAKGYNELWTQYAQKLREMVKEFGLEQSDEPASPKAKKKPRTGTTSEAKSGKEKDGAKGKSPPKAKAKPKAKPADDEEAGDAKAAENAGADEAGAATGTLPAVNGAAAKTKEEKGKDGKAEVKPADDPSASPSPAPEKAHALRKKRFVLTRSLPNLASTFGSAPGLRTMHPSEWTMGESYPLIRRALDHLEKKSSLVCAINPIDIERAQDMMKTDKYGKSEEGIRSDGHVIGLPSQEQLDAINKDAISNQKRFMAGVSDQSKKTTRKKDKMRLTS